MEKPGLSPDHRELIETLNRHRVMFVVVGGWAVIAHGYPRLTVDIDFFVGKELENARRLYSALTEFFGVKPPGLSGPDELVSVDVVQFGSPPNRVDFLSRVDGLEFEEALKGTGKFPFADKCRLISIEALIKNKRAAGRGKDLADAGELERIRKRKRRKKGRRASS